MRTCLKCGERTSVWSADLFSGVCAKCRQAEAVKRKEFCTSCLAGSTAESAGDVRTINAMGTMFLGSSGRCPTCQSRVRTVWLMAGFPLFPEGSYRVIDLDGSRFLSRRVPLSMTQVLMTWLVSYVLLVFVLGFLAWNNYKGFTNPGVDIVVGFTLLFPAGLFVALTGLVLKRLLGNGRILTFVAFVCFVGFMVAECFAVWWLLRFSSWPTEMRVITAFVAPLLLVILPGLALLRLFHGKRG